MLHNDHNTFAVLADNERVAGLLYVCPQCGAAWIEGWTGYTWTEPTTLVL